MNKKIIILALGFLVSWYSRAQNFTSIERYFLTEMVFNPAAAGSNEDLTAILSNRKTWAGMEESPRLSMFNMHFKAADLLNNSRDFIGDHGSRWGFGLGLYNDVNGELKVNSAQIAAAYYLPLSNDYMLSFGLAPKFYQSVLNENELKPTDPGDPNLSTVQQKSTFFNLNSGVYLRSRQLRLGFSATNIAPLSTDARNFYQFAKIRTWYLSCRYTFVLAENFVLEPYLLLRNYDNDFRADLLIRQRLGKHFTIGFGLATKKAYSALFSIELGDYSLGYLFEVVNSPLYGYSNGNHMFFIGKSIW